MTNSKVAEIEIQEGFILPQRVFTNKSRVFNEDNNEIVPAFRLWTLDGDYLENDDDGYCCLLFSEFKDKFIELVPVNEESEVQS
jgi:hypothetical protein